MNSRRLVFSLLIVVLALVVVALPVSGQGSVPSNGSFTGNMLGWGRNDQNTCVFDSGVGHTAAGSLRATPFCRLYSTEFIPQSGSTLSFWYKANTGDWGLQVFIRDYSVSSYSSFNIANAAQTWTESTTDLSGYAGDVIGVSVYVYSGGGGSPAGGWLDDFTVSSASAASIPSDLGFNGNYYGSAWGWSYASTNVAFNSSIGHGALGAMVVGDYNLADGFLSRVFIPSQQSWSVWIKNNPAINQVQHFDLSYYDYDGQPGVTNLVSVVNQNIADWTEYTFSFAAVMGHRLKFNTYLNWVYFDDVCPATGCVNGTPTPTIAPTNTVLPTNTTVPGGFPYGSGTPIPIDWGAYPTQPPYPTFPVYPTQIPYSTQAPYPTAIYGAGTSVPVVINGGSPIPVYVVTPFPTQLPYPTPLYGLNTPQPVVFPTNTPTPTMATANMVTGGSAPVAVANQADYRAPGSAGNLTFVPLGSSPATTEIVDVHLVHSMQYISMCNIPGMSALPFGACANVELDYVYPDRFKFAGVELLTAIYGLGAAYLFVFFLRRLQKR